MKKLWVETYRPKSISDYVWKDDAQKKQVEQWVHDQTIPHLLMSGSPGTGKTTMAKILMRELDIDPADIMDISQKDRGVDAMRNKIMNFAGTIPFGTTKIIFIDEADNISLEGQQVMRTVMETYSDNCRFILTCNYPNKIIPAIHSRCQGFHIEKLDLGLFTERVATILLTEIVEFDLDVLDTYVLGTYPDLRKCINNLQKASVNGVLMPVSEQSVGTADYRLKMVNLYKEGKFQEARKLACENVKPDEMEDMFRWMYNSLHLWGDTPEQQDKAIIIIRNGLVNHTLVGNPEINLAAVLCELTMEK